jgi:hypothetical protein
MAARRPHAEIDVNCPDVLRQRGRVGEQQTQPFVSKDFSFREQRLGNIGDDSPHVLSPDQAVFDGASHHGCLAASGLSRGRVLQPGSGDVLTRGLLAYSHRAEPRRVW